MIKDIQRHHREEEIQIVKFENQNHYWIKELGFLSEELDFYKELLSNPLKEKTKIKQAKADVLLYELKKLKKWNDVYLQECYNSQNKLENQKECDQIDCDYAFLRAQLVIQKKIEKYIEEVQALKKAIFRFLKRNPEIVTIFQN